MILFDDIGSFPLPKGITKDWVPGAIKRKDPKFPEMLKEAMRLKIEAGVDAPTYPQFQDMNRQFLEIINDDTMTEEPLLVRRDRARIIELEAMEEAGKEYRQRTGSELNVRVCVTGPVELYMNQFGSTAYADVLNNFASSIDRFIVNSIDNARNFRISTVSIDEPSIGINPQIMFSESDITAALEKAARSAASHDIDTEIHLHSPLHYKMICNVPTIGIIGVESAASPSYLDLIDKKDLEKSDKFLRIGVARTDIFNMSSALNEKYGVNVWKDTGKLEDIITVMETPEVIEKRLGKAHSIFGDRIKYAGPDCGLGSWPTQDMAFRLLKNTSIGIKRFLKNNITG